MEIAAILTVASGDSPRRAFSLAGRTAQSESCYARLEILGASILDRTISKLHQLGIRSPKVLSGCTASDHVLPLRSPRSGTFVESWEKEVSDCVASGAETIFLIRVENYTDLDYSELLRFHRETGSALTQVYGTARSVDIAVVNAKLLRNADDLVRRALTHLIPQQKRFFYDGYVNRLGNEKDVHRLMQDGLSGTCQLRPEGKESRPGIWCGAGAEVDSTVSLEAPVFIGRGTTIGAGCVISGISSVESNCQIDCGSVIDNSLVLDGTYIGLALDVRNSVVKDKRIFHVEKNVAVDVYDSRLVGRIGRPGRFNGLMSLLRSDAQACDSEGPGI